jgi:anti-repressor protein
MAKEISIVENNEKGKEIRRYFIECEKKLSSQQYQIPKTLSEALRLGAELAEKNEKLLLENSEMKPKADFYDDVAGSKDAIDLGTVAKILDKDIGRNKLFQFLRDKKILMNNNQPYQQYIDSEYFRVIEQKYQDSNGNTHISFKTLVYQKGVEYINNLLK